MEILKSFFIENFPSLRMLVRLKIFNYSTLYLQQIMNITKDKRISKCIIYRNIIMKYPTIMWIVFHNLHRDLNQIQFEAFQPSIQDE